MDEGQGIIDETALNIFTDGSSFPQKQRAAGVGVIFVWVDEQGHEVTDGFSPPGYKSATIDEMEIQACIVALQEAMRLFKDLNQFKRILLFSDSRYVVNNFSSAINIWPKRKWLGANNLPVANIELWKKLGREVRQVPLRVDLQWVKAHKRNRHNSAADKLAKLSASVPINKPLSVSATTRKWSDRMTKPGSVLMKGQVTKIRIVSHKLQPKANITKYRYEVIDPGSEFFKDLDFVYCSEILSRNKCYEVQFNREQMRPTIVNVLAELDGDNYKY